MLLVRNNKEILLGTIKKYYLWNIKQYLRNIIKILCTYIINWIFENIFGKIIITKKFWGNINICTNNIIISINPVFFRTI